MVLLDTGTPGTSREICSKDADDDDGDGVASSSPIIGTEIDKEDDQIELPDFMFNTIMPLRGWGSEARMTKFTGAIQKPLIL